MLRRVQGVVHCPLDQSNNGGPCGCSDYGRASARSAAGIPACGAGSWDGGERCAVAGFIHQLPTPHAAEVAPKPRQSSVHLQVWFDVNPGWACSFYGLGADKVALACV